MRLKRDAGLCPWLLSILICLQLPAPAKADDLYTQGIRAMIIEKNYQKAEKLIEQAVQEAEDKGDFGRDYPQKLANLASCYTHNHNLPKAEIAYKKLISGSETNNELNPNAIYGLAKTYFDEGKFAQAEPLFRRASVQFDTQVGKDNPLSKGFLVGWAKCLRKLGKDDEAAALEKRANAISQIQGW